MCVRMGTFPFLFNLNFFSHTLVFVKELLVLLLLQRGKKYEKLLEQKRLSFSNELQFVCSFIHLLVIVFVVGVLKKSRTNIYK